MAEKERDQFLHDATVALQDHLVNEWFKFGLYLGLSITDLNVLEANSIACPDKRICVRHMLTKWKDKFGKEATWDKIVDALRKIEQSALAQDLEDKYMQSRGQETGEY